MKKSPVYQKWKNITDKIYSGELTAEQGTTQLVELLVENNIKLRANNHILLGVSFFVYDKSDWSRNKEKPLGLGLVYKKPDTTKTQDIFIVPPDGEIEKVYSEKNMLKKYSWMKAVHKKILPL